MQDAGDKQQSKHGISGWSPYMEGGIGAHTHPQSKSARFLGRDKSAAVLAHHQGPTSSGPMRRLLTSRSTPKLGIRNSKLER
jgi:hypothetical protein